MADSSLAIAAEDITDLESGAANASAVVDANFNTITAAFNAAFETATGHSHDGTDSSSLALGIAGMTSAQWSIVEAAGGLL
jgi:hypothetical protein